MIDQATSLLIAAALGALLGVERSIAGKQAGMRTYALVSLGSCLFVALGTTASVLLVGAFPAVNPLQLAGSIIVGIGFIGSGLAVMRASDNHAELTTASGLWVVAGIGMACGFGLYVLAVATAIIALCVLTLFLKFENAVRKSYPRNNQ